jgi:hypothetical protein
LTAPPIQKQRPIFGALVFSQSIGMDLTTRFRILKTECEFLPVAERMAQLAAPDKRNKVVRLIAAIDQDIAKWRDEIDREIEWRR